MRQKRARGRKPAHKSGFVSLLGRPNSGKSTLLNALVGTKLAIVADKPQTTRTTIQGVWTEPGAQVVFVDTPGIHDAETVFNRRMMESIREALDERDLLVYVIDATRAPEEADEKALELVRRAGTPALAVFNKIDLIEDKRQLLPLLDRYQRMFAFEEYVPLSALTGDGLEELRMAILGRMPEGPAWFPEDHLTDQPERYMAAELIREKILESTRQEVPHAAAVTIDEWDEQGRLVRIAATVHVERAGQKVILLGARGERMKRIGTAARLEIEALTGKRVFLKLFVKVSPKWREDERFLRELDWRAMLGGEKEEAGGEPES